MSGAFLASAFITFFLLCTLVLREHNTDIGVSMTKSYLGLLEQ